MVPEKVYDNLNKKNLKLYHESGEIQENCGLRFLGPTQRLDCHYWSNVKESHYAAISTMQCQTKEKHKRIFITDLQKGEKGSICSVLFKHETF